mmetsp:Transcript_21486/g.37660  ORF Transcript_21486/g.37660 Transcript_21486/m.37660 type:complete len:142 (-) Transcript_21486:30-455(-)
MKHKQENGLSASKNPDVSVQLLAVSEVAMQGGLPRTSMQAGLGRSLGRISSRSSERGNSPGYLKFAEEAKSFSGSKLCHHGDIFSPSIQAEVDRVRADLHELSSEVVQVRDGLGTLNGKLDKVMGMLTLLTMQKNGASIPL